MWIEIQFVIQTMRIRMVTPLAGVWIEIGIWKILKI